MGALIILGPGSTQISPDRGPVASPSIDEYSELGGREIGIGHHSRSQGLPDEASARVYLESRLWPLRARDLAR